MTGLPWTTLRWAPRGMKGLGSTNRNAMDCYKRRRNCSSWGFLVPKNVNSGFWWRNAKNWGRKLTKRSKKPGLIKSWSRRDDGYRRCQGALIVSVVELRRRNAPGTAPGDDNGGERSEASKMVNTIHQRKWIVVGGSWPHRSQRRAQGERNELWSDPWDGVLIKAWFYSWQKNVPNVNKTGNEGGLDNGPKCEFGTSNDYTRLGAQLVVFPKCQSSYY